MSSIEFHNSTGNSAVIKSEYLSVIRDRLSVKDEAARFIKKKNPYYPDRKFMITKSGKFECGLIFEIINTIKSLGLYAEVSIDTVLKKKIRPAFFNDKINQLATLTIEPYDYQEECVNTMLSNGRGTILVGTGGGKTLIMALFIKTVFEQIHPKRTLIIVPTIQLVEQTYKDIIEYGIDASIISKWSGDNSFSNTQIIIAGDDILQSENSDLAFLSDIELLIIDEVHILKKDNLINNIVKGIPTPNRYGFTGTLPENIIDQWNVTGKIGKVIYTKESAALRDLSVISPVKIHIINLKYNTKTHLELHDIVLGDKTEYQREIEFCISNPFRNGIISTIATTTKANTLVMVDRIAHGEELFKILSQKTNKQVYFIQGDVEVSQREDIRCLMENESNVICIAISSIFSTGINIKNIHNIIFCTPGKAKVKLIQSIGRGVRLHKDKARLTVYDIADEFKYSNRHVEKRFKLYDQEKIKYEIKELRQPDS